MMDSTKDSERRGAAAASAILHHIGLHVTSLERSLKFYQDCFGFEMAFRWSPDAPYIKELLGDPKAQFEAAILKLPDSNVVLELMEYLCPIHEPADPASAVPGTAHIGFAVTDLDEIYSRLVDAGVSSISRPVTPTIGPNRGGRVVYLLDPDGIRVELIQSSNWLYEFGGGPAC